MYVCGGARLPFTVVAAVDSLGAATSTAETVEEGPASDLGLTEDETSNDRDDLEVTVVDPVTPVETSFSSICDLLHSARCAQMPPPPTSMPLPPVPPLPPFPWW